MASSNTANLNPVSPVFPWQARGWRPPHPCPTGFVHFIDLLATYENNKTVWRPAMVWREGFFPAHRRIAEGLLSGTFRAAGLCRIAGTLVWIPADNWRSPQVVGASEQTSREWAVMMGMPLLCGSADGKFECFPILQSRDLAVACEASNPPPLPPQSVLDQVREAEWPITPGRPPVRNDPAAVRSRTGPKPDLSELVASRMRTALAEERYTPASLLALKKTELPGLFGGGETTCLKVRRAVLQTASNSDRTANNDK